MLDYTNYYRRVPTLQQRGLERTFEKHYLNTLEGFDVTIDGMYKKKSLIQKHSNPINSHLEDKYFTILNKEAEGLKWGSYIEGYEDKRYIVLTYPETTDGVTLKAKIRKTTGKCQFTTEDGKSFEYDCIDTNYLLYDDKTYTTDTKVFEEDERKAVVVPYNQDTSLLRVIDDVELKGNRYKIIKIEFITEEVQGEKQGVVQLVLIRTSFGTLLCNDSPLRGIVRFARMKDKVLNSKSRELITDHNQVKSGDYIKHTYTRDEQGEIETRYYLVRSLVDMYLDYDVTYIINCDAEFYMWNEDKKEPIMIPCYVEDNKTRFEDSDKSNLILGDSQFQIIVQENEFTKKLGTSVDRIIIKGKAYDVVGTDNLSLENAIYVGLSDTKIDPNKDNIELGIGSFDTQCPSYKNKATNTSKDTTVTVPSTSLEIIGEKEVVFGQTYSYKINTIEKVEWTIDDTKLGKITNSQNNEIALEINSSPKNIGKCFNLSCKINDTIYTKEITIKGWD